MGNTNKEAPKGKVEGRFGKLISPVKPVNGGQNNTDSTNNKESKSSNK